MFPVAQTGVVGSPLGPQGLPWLPWALSSPFSSCPGQGGRQRGRRGVHPVLRNWHCHGVAQPLWKLGDLRDSPAADKEGGHGLSHKDRQWDPWVCSRVDPWVCSEWDLWFCST